MIKPNPFIKKCTQCNWSKKFYPESDVVDLSWGVEVFKCPKCGSDIIKVPLEEPESNKVLDLLINTFGKK
ncbi:hypothetical protein LCX93_11430 [Sulfurimonas sp. SWIR-19]|uniref:hypothetical protein n=1 Tax=Sulfurimonas sp. SWIR-19 TaxID=2878390 RepID=UPI001CF0F3CB|nr:hypothetical protein [Sulfurimonas sp. SWIR-19]UCN00122.1 hypothetical protein LCX93_11430 [Sulfurimonas sp. SWIR-19]